MKTKKVFHFITDYFTAPLLIRVYIRLLGLSESEMLEVLENIHDEALTTAGATLIQDYKERRFLLVSSVVGDE